VVIQKQGETIPPPGKTEPPKKMPDGKDGIEPPQMQIQILNPGNAAPLAPPALQNPPAATPMVNPTGLPGRPF
jgi:hypothetical protein